MLTTAAVLSILFGAGCLMTPIVLFRLASEGPPSSGSLGMLFLAGASLILIPLGGPFIVAGLSFLAGSPGWVLLVPFPLAFWVLGLTRIVAGWLQG